MHRPRGPIEHGSVVLAKRATDPNSYALAVQKSSFNGQYTAASVIVTLSIALALYNSLEMILLIFSTFKRRRGLYFWSLSLCTFGVILYTIGMILDYFSLGVLWLGKTILDIGWILMVACQSLVLYSRLGLIYDNPKILGAVKWMIITTSIALLPTVCILDFGDTYSNIPAFAQAYYYIEHIQMTVITLQELIISGLYVWKTVKLLKIISKAKMRSMVWQLFTINVIIIAMDVLLVVLQYKHLQLYQESIKAFVYSVKLKLELNILSRLVDLVHGNKASTSMTLNTVDSNAIEVQTPAEMRQESKGSEQLSTDYFSTKFASTDKGTVQHNEIEYATPSKLEASFGYGGRPDHDDALEPVVSSHSRYTSRTSGRESDVLYADFLRDMK